MPSLSFASPKFIYTADAVICTVASVGLLLGNAALADLIELPQATTLIIAVGAFLLPWGLFNYGIGTAASSTRSSVLLNMIGDGSWVVLSAVLLAAHWHVLNALGHALMIGQMLFVALVFATKLRGAAAMLGR